MTHNNHPYSIADAAAEDGPEHYKQLCKIFDEHMMWLAAWHRAAFIDTTGPRELPKLRCFMSWFRHAAPRLQPELPIIDRMAVLHDELHTYARSCLQNAGRSAVDGAAYDQLTARFNAFLSLLCQFKLDFNAASNGFDTVTGLRSRFSMNHNMAAEQKRSEWSGQPFSLAFITTNEFESIQRLHGDDTVRDVLRHVTRAIARHIQPFDDVYRIHAGDFVICFKGLTIDAVRPLLANMATAAAAETVRLFGGGGLNVSIRYAAATADNTTPVCDQLHDLMAEIGL